LIVGFLSVCLLGWSLAQPSTKSQSLARVKSVGPELAGGIFFVDYLASVGRNFLAFVFVSQVILDDPSSMLETARIVLSVMLALDKWFRKLVTR
jgi:hypothetical protein